ncbi:MAG: DNA repair protein RecO [Nitrospirota bacterium]|nr:DNA repair protein RecO [Nitrospirota bacterium]MDH5586162.1 DNA repair protein RecO [Nitrospirota bacterium]MDH5775027.1 DNA repair protein RecO [Nitrospirota bacterium]
MPLIRTRGIILKSQKWGDADRIITVYSPNFGKIRGAARGARRMKTRFGGVLEPFGLVDLTLFQKTPESLGQISQIDLVSSYSSIRENLTVMTAAARMVKMVEAITVDRDPNPGMYAALVHGLESLCPEDDVALSALLFQIHVLGHTGFRPQFDSCTECGQMAQGHRPQWFSPRLGGVVCHDCGQRGVGRMVSLSKGSVAFIEQARRLSMSNLSRLKAIGSVRVEVETAMEAYFYAVVGKPLPTFEHWVF